MKLLRQTENIRLEPMTTRHLGELTRLFNDGKTLEYLKVKKIHALPLAHRSEVKLNRGEAGLYVLFDKTTNVCLGRAGVRNNSTGKNIDWELHILLHGHAQGRGLGREVILATMRDTFDNQGAEKISFVIAQDNRPMQKLASNLGFFPKLTQPKDGYLHFEIMKQDFNLMHTAASAVSAVTVYAPATKSL